MEGTTPRRSSSAGWTVGTLLGIGGWGGLTVYVAATNDNPSDPTPILRTFALAGGVFFGVVLVLTAVQMRRTGSRASELLYRRLAVTEVSPEVLRAAGRQGTRTGYVYLVATGLTTALLLAAIGLGEQGPYRLLFTAMAVLVIGWAAYAVLALRRAYGAATDILAPLGLSITEVPALLVGDGGRLVGTTSYRGVRHGRRVAVDQTPRLAVTVVGGRYPHRSVTSPTTISAMTGLPARTWRGVTARSGDDGVTVRRVGNGAGRWYLHDLLLAENLAANLAGNFAQNLPPTA